jgi:hypothetical protein
MVFRFHQEAKVLIIIALAMILASCSVKTLYNQLDYLIPYYVEGMVSLDDMLEEKVEQRTLVLISWHRNTQLNQYAKWLGDLQRDINQELTEEKLQSHITQLGDFWQSILLKINEEMALLIPLLNIEQRNELFASLDEKNDEFLEEFVNVTNEKRIEKYTERMMDSYENWLGELTGEQKKAIKQVASEMQSTAKLRLERRRQWQRSIQRILYLNDDNENKSKALREYFAEYNSQQNTEMDKIANQNKKRLTRLTLNIVRSMDDEQKDHFMTITNDYIRMFKELAS